MNPESSTESTVDVNVPRFNQAAVALLTALGFVFGKPWLVVATFAILAVSWTAGPTVAPFTQLYVRFIRPRLHPGGPTEFEPAAPPRFAQLIGAVILGVASFALVAGWETIGWALTLVVNALATLAATTRICVGCILYERTVIR
ncbi:MAG: DUF4395 domain-containing protein [Acidimicrobiia bacterium]|nr:DUF4395 domain-containing protein [Acidimicrobiia bacterium]